MTTLESTRLDTMEDKLDNVSDKVDKMYSAMMGSDMQLDKGLIGEFKDLRARVSNIEAFKNKVIWICIGAGVAAGISANKIIEWIQMAAK